jgi:chromosome segregation ATPase
MDAPYPWRGKGGVMKDTERSATREEAKALTNVQVFTSPMEENKALHQELADLKEQYKTIYEEQKHLVQVNKDQAEQLKYAKEQGKAGCEGLYKEIADLRKRYDTLAEQSKLDAEYQLDKYKELKSQHHELLGLVDKHLKWYDGHVWGKMKSVEQLKAFINKAKGE